jgi:hypothetical protein
MITLPFWIQQRGVKAEEINERTFRLVGTDFPASEISVFPMPAGHGWRVAVDLLVQGGRQTVARTESPFENEDAAWNAGFELLRQRIES